MIFGSFLIFFTLLWALVCCNKKFAKLVPICSIAVTNIITFKVLDMIQENTSGFETADPKEMLEVIINVNLLLMLLFPISLQIEFCLTIPMAMMGLY